MSIKAFCGLKVLLDFLVEQSDSLEMPLGGILGGMNIDFRVDEKPTEDAIWYDWKVSFALLSEDENFFKDPPSSCQETLKSEQVFMAGFHFLDDYFWRNNNAIFLLEVIGIIGRCIDDLEQDRKNPLWEVWLKYFEEELRLNKEYSFD